VGRRALAVCFSKGLIGRRKKNKTLERDFIRRWGKRNNNNNNNKNNKGNNKNHIIIINRNIVNKETEKNKKHL